MKIDETSNEEASYLIREAVVTSRNHKQEHLETDIHELINQDREMEVDINNDEDDMILFIRGEQQNCRYQQ